MKCLADLLRRAGVQLIPVSLSFSRYKAFRDFTRVEFLPLTIIIGPNGGGKSVLTRLPLLLAGGLIQGAEAPLELESGGVRHAVRFEDLIFQRSSQPFSIGAEISDGVRSIGFSTTLLHISEKHIIGIESFDLFEKGERVLKLRAKNPEDIGVSAGTFIIERIGSQAAFEAAVRFVGLFPVEVIGYDQISAQLIEARGLFEEVFAAPSYLGPFRSEQGSLPRIPRQGVSTLGPRGEHALDILGDNRLRSDGRLTAAVEEWFESSMAGSRLNLTLTGDLPRILVHDPIRALDVDISETGAGFAQVLPIVVQAFARRQGFISSSMVIVEQPELHLHPAVHGNVMDLIIGTVRENPTDVRYICETHSEQIVTRLRRRIAEGLISSDLVRVLSVGHRASEEDEPEPIRVIQFDRFGNPDSWPIGVFDEVFNDLVQLREAGQKQIGKAVQVVETGS